MNEHSRQSDGNKEGGGGDFGGDRSADQTSRGSNPKGTAGSFIRNNLEHVADSSKKIIAFTGVLGGLGIIGSNMLGFVRGYESVIERVHKEVFKSVPDAPYELPNGNTVTLYNQIRVMQIQVDQCAANVDTIGKLVGFNQAHEDTPTPKFFNPKKGRR